MDHSDTLELRQMYKHLNDDQFSMMMGLQREQRDRWAARARGEHPAEGYYNGYECVGFNFFCSFSNQ